MKKKATDNAKIQTNTTKDSVCNIEITPIIFNELWENYVGGKPYDDPNGNYENQCAIRLSATFHKSGIKMLSFSQKTVKPMPGKPSLGRLLLDGKPTATRAYELAEWLKLVPFCGIPPKPEEITGSDWKSKIKDRTGIVFFYAYWRQDGDTEGSLTGGHIDLWNGSRFPNGSILSAIANFTRFTLGVGSLRALSISDLANSKKILFWPIR